MKKPDREHWPQQQRDTRITPVTRRRRGVLRAALIAVGLSTAGTLTAWLWASKFPATMAAEPVAHSSSDGKTYTNRLIHSHSPYLLLHAHNPVDWYPWGPGAFAAAKRENKPIFLSVGYSTCYWCHVAEREIYSNPDIAKLMNHWFINVKVDREQRPDVDRVYMLATRMMTGGGGWPNNVFLTPDLKPIYAGSYFPPQDQGGRPGFPRIIEALHQAWVNDRAQVVEVSEQVYRALQQAQGLSGDAKSVPVEAERWLDEALQQSAARFDEVNHGFSGGGSTMFPQAPVLAMLLADDAWRHNAEALSMATVTLRAMAEGGVMDQLAGGFHRYSTEPSWSIPHFEKTLYDNAQLLGLYARAYAITQQTLFRQVALRTARYLTTEMRAADGGFYSAQDSQIDGVEGVSYVWTRPQIESVLGVADTARFFTLYALKPMPESHAGQKQPPGGVLRLDRDLADELAEQRQLANRLEALAPLRTKLLAARNRRPQPARDEKIVTADNALAILGFLEAGLALEDASLIRTAAETANWQWTQVFDPEAGLLRHQFFHGHAGDDGFLDDYALLGQAFLALHQATGDTVWHRRAQRTADAMLERFAQPDGALATTAATDLLVAPPVEGDSTQPSGQSAAVALLLGLAADGGDARYATAARLALAPLAAQIAAQPYGWGAMVASLSRPAAMAMLNGAQAPPQTAQSLPSSADHVRGTAHITSSGELRVVVTIADGYHINANPASDPNLIPTQLTLGGDADVTVDYPEGELFKPPFAPQGLAVYTGQIALRAHLPRQAPTPTQAQLRVQACNDQYCLMPATLELPVNAAQ